MRQGRLRAGEGTPGDSTHCCATSLKGCPVWKIWEPQQLWTTAATPLRLRGWQPAQWSPSPLDARRQRPYYVNARRWPVEGAAASHRQCVDRRTSWERKLFAALGPPSGQWSQ
ncbi:hypothetical protein CKAH01_00978 [Colletotrichum kahawae]|uniref:Uncharacterized protein n=1 Tax=Colletotrichum kahawae TaxID=34407 RepID=A0AAE0D935_COLKA|nr:hypothetical protein CKAH01_00978 [Colletotrichum kahawae]